MAVDGAEPRRISRPQLLDSPISGDRSATVALVIAASVERILRDVGEDASVLDVGGWGKPFVRADFVIDQMPYETRGLYGFDGDGPERFDAASWVQRDMCDREPWPFADQQFDFVICSQTLEDLRDPVWVCSELTRVAKAGYIEVPSRLEEQTFGVQGPWVGWGHHHWLVEVTPGRIEFVFKHHVMHGNPRAHFPAEFVTHLTGSERVQQLWWTGSFEYGERTFVDAPRLDGYLESYVTTELARRGLSPAGAAPRAWRRWAMGVRRRLQASLPGS